LELLQYEGFTSLRVSRIMRSHNLAKEVLTLATPECVVS